MAGLPWIEEIGRLEYVLEGYEHLHSVCSKRSHYSTLGQSKDNGIEANWWEEILYKHL